MTREEAIKWLIKPVVTSTEIGEIKAKELEAYHMAIDALSEPSGDKGGDAHMNNIDPNKYMQQCPNGADMRGEKHEQKI